MQSVLRSETSQMTMAGAELRKRLAGVEAEVGRAAQGTALDGLGVPDVAVVWAALPLQRRRAVIDLMRAVTGAPGSAGAHSGLATGTA